MGRASCRSIHLIPFSNQNSAHQRERIAVVGPLAMTDSRCATGHCHCEETEGRRGNPASASTWGVLMSVQSETIRMRQQTDKSGVAGTARRAVRSWLPHVSGEVPAKRGIGNPGLLRFERGRIGHQAG